MKAVGPWIVPSSGAWMPAPSSLQIFGIFVALALSLLLAERRGLKPHIMYWAGAWGVVGALVGGQLWAAFCELASSGGSSMSWTGPRGVIGAFGGAFLAGGLYVRLKRHAVLTYADVATPAIALGYAVARLGCLLAGDDFGIPTDLPWAIRFEPGTEIFSVQVAAGIIAPGATETLPVHPTQLYHAALGLLGFIVLLQIRSPTPGAVLAWALVIYGAGRFAIQYFRGDTAPLFGPFEIHHFVSLAMIAVGLVLRYRRVLMAINPGRAEAT
jgi:phosphatidylglycerol---prolipoprotein diacylglyceryl transferase